MILKRMKGRFRTDDAVQAALVGRALDDDDGMAALVGVADLLEPSVAPTETFREDLRAAMMRQFTRPAGRGGAGRDSFAFPGRDTETPKPVTVRLGDTASVTMADIDDLDPVDAANRAETLLGLVTRARARRG